MWLLWLVVGIVFLFPVTWFFYVGIMYIKRVRREREEAGNPLHWLVIAFAFPFGVIGLVLDVVLNCSTCILIFREMPKLSRDEFLTTARLQRHVLRSTWRGRVAAGICDIFLEPFEKNHCGRDG